MKRHNGRILAIQALYDMDINGLDQEKTIEFFDYIKEEALNDNPTLEIDDNYGKYLIVGTMESLNTIDNVISSSLTKYTIDRLSYLDRAIIRSATFELIRAKIAKEIIINEAIEITREYSEIVDDVQVKFTNSLLDKISKKISNNE